MDRVYVLLICVQAHTHCKHLFQEATSQWISLQRVPQSDRNLDLCTKEVSILSKMVSTECQKTS